MKSQSSGMGSSEPRTQNLVINYKEHQYKILYVRPDTYTHLQLLSDVSDSVLMNVPSNVTVYVALYLPIPGTYATMEVVNDSDLKIMFGLYSEAENIDLVLLVTHTLPLPGLYEEELGHGYAIADPGPNPIWFSLDDVRRKVSILPELEDQSMNLGQGADLERMAGTLRTEIPMNDGGDEAGGFMRNMELGNAGIFNAPAMPYFCPCDLYCPFNLLGEQHQGGAEPEVDYAEVDQWMNLDGDSEKH